MASQWEQIKWIPGTPFMVDGFKFQSPRCRHYFLTHYHSDHTIGLNSGFSAGTIYCSHVTSNLLIRDMRVNPSCIRALPLDMELVIEGIRVTLLDANHCPGAVLLLFKTPPQKGSTFSHEVILHTGDMRWNPRMGKYPALAKQRIDQLFLDTTYASPKHTFPSQERAICKVVELMTKHRAQEPRTLFVMGSYRIGKERAYLGAAKALGYRCHVNADKLRVLRLLGLPEADLKLITKDKNAAQIHVSFMGKTFLPEVLRERIADTQWTHVVAFRPTGWSFQKKGVNVRRDGNITIYGIPYSEHSSYDELRDCVRTLRPRKLVPTVNAADPISAKALVDRFAELMDLSKDRGRLDFFLKKAKTVPAASLDAAARNQSRSGGAPSRAGSAPPATSATGVCDHMDAACDRMRDASTRPASTGMAAAENEEALYWQQHGEIEEEDGGFEEGPEFHDAAADLKHLDASWRSIPGYGEMDDDHIEPAENLSTYQPCAVSASNATKLESELPCHTFGRQAIKKESSATSRHPARVKQEPLELHSSAGACQLKHALDPVASLRRFSYSGRPLKKDEPQHASHGCHDDSRDSKVLVHLGLDSPKAKLLPSTAPGSCASLLSKGTGAAVCSSAPVQARRDEECCGAPHTSTHHESTVPSAAPHQQSTSYAQQQMPACVEQAVGQHTCQEHAAEGAHLRLREQTSVVEGDPLPPVSPSDSWATASEGSQGGQGQGALQDDSISPACTPQHPSRAQASCNELPVTDICSPESAAQRQPAHDHSVTGVKRECGSTGAACESAGIRSPGGSESVDLSAVDMEEQRRILCLIAARKSLQEDIQASRACMQALSAQALPDQGLKKRGRAAGQAHKALVPVAATKRRQLGIGTFLLSQQRSDRM